MAVLRIWLDFGVCLWKSVLIQLKEHFYNVRQEIFLTNADVTG